MKKLFSLLILLTLGIGVSYATVETIELTAAAQNYENAQEVTTVTGDVVTLTFDKASSSTAPAYYTTGDAVRLYNGGTLTIEAGGATITKIEFVYELQGSATISLSPGTFDAETKTWTGSATAVVATAGSAKHIRFSKVTVTYDGTTVPPSGPAAPTINGDNTKSYVEGDEVEVSITNNDDNATVKYALDDSDWMDYTEPIILTSTTTVKAKAVNVAGAESSVVNKKFNFKKSISTIWQFNSLDEGVDFVFTASVIAIAQSGNNLYVQDAAGEGMLVYGATNQTYELGDVIPAGFSGRRSVYNTMPEMTNPADFGKDGTATPTVNLFDIDDITLENFAAYAFVEGVTVDGNKISKDGDEIATFTTFCQVPEDTEGKLFNVYGVVGAFKNEAQFLPIEYTPYTEPEQKLYLVGSFSGDNGWDPSEAIEMEYNQAGFYMAALDLKAGDEFKFIGQQEWDGLVLGAVTENEDTPFELAEQYLDGSPLSLATPGANFKVMADGYYNIGVSIDDMVVGIDAEIEVEDDELYIVGTFSGDNGWDLEEAEQLMFYDETGTFEIIKEFEANTEFKLVAALNWDDETTFGGVDNENAGFFLVDPYLETNITMVNPGANFKIEAAGEYEIVADKENKILVVNPINIPVTGIEVKEDNVTLDLGGDTYQIEASVVPATATNKTLLYESSDEGVITVDENGLVTAVKSGTWSVVNRAPKVNAVEPATANVNIYAPGVD
ncbi:MAG: SusF/SusE family outer membrane protein, partial [Muribaculaceae bacterium]|nr:SusF/SusE family outer membrane protein [Muribaculaceae bacterium]